MIIIRPFIVLLFILFCVGNTSIIAQVDTIPEISKSGWVSLAFGANTLGGATGLLEVSIQRDNKLYSGRLQGGSGGNSFAEAGLLFGRAYQSNNMHSAISAGPSFVASGNGSGGRGTVFGLALGAQAFLRFPGFGLGVYVTGNINDSSSNAAITLGIQFGRLNNQTDN